MLGKIRVVCYGSVVVESDGTVHRQEQPTIITSDNFEELLTDDSDARRRARIAKARANQSQIWQRKRICSPTSS